MFIVLGQIFDGFGFDRVRHSELIHMSLHRHPTNSETNKHKFMAGGMRAHTLILKHGMYMCMMVYRCSLCIQMYIIRELYWYANVY